MNPFGLNETEKRRLLGEWQARQLAPEDAANLVRAARADAGLRREMAAWQTIERLLRHYGIDGGGGEVFAGEVIARLREQSDLHHGFASAVINRLQHPQLSSPVEPPEARQISTDPDFAEGSSCRLRLAPHAATSVPFGSRDGDDKVIATIYCAPRPRSLFRRSLQTAAALAAALTLIAGGWRWWQSGQPVVQALLETSGAGATIQRGDRQFGADGAWVARAGDVIRTVEESTGVLRFHGEQTVLTIAGDSELALELKEGKRLELRHGGLEARVAPQPQGQPLVCVTPHVKITVLGTRFVVTTHSQASRVIVREGKVRVTDRATGVVAELVGGQLAMAGPGTSLKVLNPRITVTASADDGNVPENILDGDFDTRWSARGEQQWIKFDLGSPQTVTAVRLAFFRGDRRRFFFDIETSTDDSRWTAVLTGGESSGTSNDLQTFKVATSIARYVRIIGHGCSGKASLWNSYTEVEIP